MPRQELDALVGGELGVATTLSATRRHHRDNVTAIPPNFGKGEGAATVLIVEPIVA